MEQRRASALDQGKKYSRAVAQRKTKAMVRIDPVGCHNADDHKIHDRHEQKRLVGSTMHCGRREDVPVFVGVDSGKEVLLVGEGGHDGFWPEIWECG